jgi:hypothetical protein
MSNIDTDYTESVLDKIDLIEKEYLNTHNKAAEYLILDRISYRQLLYERNTPVIVQYHGYTIATVKDDFDEVIRFI